MTVIFVLCNDVALNLCEFLNVLSVKRFLDFEQEMLDWPLSKKSMPNTKKLFNMTYYIYFYFLHMNEEHLNIQQWNSKTQNTYNKHV